MSKNLLHHSGKDLVDFVLSDLWTESQPNLSEILVSARQALKACDPSNTEAIKHYKSIISEIEQAIFKLNLDQD